MNRAEALITHENSANPKGYKEPLAHPTNCKTECPYGYGKAFCFPCMARLLAEQRASKKSTAPVERELQKEGIAI